MNKNKSKWEKHNGDYAKYDPLDDALLQSGFDSSKPLQPVEPAPKVDWTALLEAVI